MQVPYELLNKRFRSAQKTFDREFHSLASALNEIEKCMESGNATNGSMAVMLDGVAEKLSSMKRKVKCVNFM